MFKKININTISYIMGPFFYLLSLNHVIYYNFLNSIILFIIASLIFPPSFKKIKKELKLSNNYDFNDFPRLALLIILLLLFSFMNPGEKLKNTNLDTPSQENEIEGTENTSSEENINSEKFLYQVNSVVDGDTIKVLIENEIKTVRLIGIDSPETSYPKNTVECFGEEASLKLKELVNGKKVLLQKDDTQDDLDKYGRLLRYVYLEDGTSINKFLVEKGYAREYTYLLPYLFQEEFKEAENWAKENSLGIWDKTACQDLYTEVESERDEACSIKGNISHLTEEKIYHLPGCKSYQDVTINESKGERWFCNENEAIDAGWRVAQNCF